MHTRRFSARSAARTWVSSFPFRRSCLQRAGYFPDEHTRRFSARSASRTCVSCSGVSFEWLHRAGYLPVKHTRRFSRNSGRLDLAQLVGCQPVVVTEGRVLARQTSFEIAVPRLLSVQRSCGDETESEQEHRPSGLQMALPILWPNGGNKARGQPASQNCSLYSPSP